ncbi:unnamed protein product [Rotaria socialis]|uniref:Uncharacterized protein n=6 Tax=Rotaria socialis TaxID=392032 RepID=A0A820N3G7_9BILA|nr:unnamed protein product [Rotaria socialis]CAF4382031.1 unnamed protein product [Rotaria socialis]
MERDDGDGGSDNIQTPNTSRSNSINEDETRFSPPIAPINELETQSPEIVDEQIKHMPETQLSIISSSSSNSDTDFVAINKSDFDSEVDLTTFYAEFPSIFGNNTSCPIEPSYNTVAADVNKKQSYQPMFGSFLFADSDPLSRAAFAASSSSSPIEVPTTQEQVMDDHALTSENNASSSIQDAPSLVTPVELAEDIDDDNDEDDFDGIPIRHAPVMMNKKLNDDNEPNCNRRDHDQSLDEFINHVENAHNDYELEDDSFLNGFSDEQHDTTAIVPTLFKDIPDIDDPNEHDEDNDDGIPFDQMDMYNQSESLRSSSPDSLLSSSHLQDEQDDDINIDDDNEVTNWNDDTLLRTNSSNINAQTNQTDHPLILRMHPMDQVDFIDSSRSNSRCSHVSSHLSFGYNDQARIFRSDDDELVTSSDSDDDDDDNNDDTINIDSNLFNQNDKMNLDSNTFNQDDNEDLRLEVNLDDHRSVSSFSKSDSVRSASSIAHETPIIDIDDDDDDIDQSKTLQIVPITSMDDDHHASNTLQVAPMAALDDEDENDDFQTFQSEQPVLPMISSNINGLFELMHEQRKTDIVHDIIHMRHLFDENNHDDEFIAIMHNPKIFEEVLYEHDDDNNNNNNNNNNEQANSDSTKQTTTVTATFRSSSQLSAGNQIKNEPLGEHHQNIQQPSSLLELDNKKMPSSSLHALYRTATTTTPTANNPSPAAANYLSKDDSNDDVVVSGGDGGGGGGKGKNNATANVVNTATDNINIIQRKEQLQSQSTNSFEVVAKQFTNVDKYEQIMSTDNESDDDSELAKTLSQLHNIINTTSPREEINRIEQQMSLDSSSTNQNGISSELLFENIITNGNESELLNKKNRQDTPIILSSPYVNDTVKNSDESKEERGEKKKIIFHKNHNDDDDDGNDHDMQGEKYENEGEGGEEKTTTFFSLTSTTSHTLFNNDSHSVVASVDPDTSSSSSNILLLSSNKLNDSAPVLTNQLITDILQISNKKSNMDDLSNDDLTQLSTTNLFDPFAPTTTTTTDMFENIFTDVKTVDEKEFKMQPNSNVPSKQPLDNYNFDDLWNQSVSQIVSSSSQEIKSDTNYDANAFSWDAFLNNDTNNEKKLNPFDDENVNDISNTILPPANITWESLFGEMEPEDNTDLKNFLDWIISHLEESEQSHVEPTITYTSTQNLESIVKDIQMCAMPFDPIPSPPLHVDHSVANPLINAIHHELFPINELEQMNTTNEQPSMIIYEEDEDEIEEEEEEEEEEDNELSPNNIILQNVVEKLVSHILTLALEQVNHAYNQIDHFVDQILSQAIFEVYNEDKDSSESEINDMIPTENLTSIINDHDSTTTTATTVKEKFDPSDEKIDSTWIHHFQTPKTSDDSWLPKAAEHHNNVDPMSFFSNTFDESDLFSSASNPTKLDDDEAGTLSEYLPPPILTDTSKTAMAVNNMMKYTLTAPVIDDSGDDSSFQEDFFNLHKNESSTVEHTKINEEPIKAEDSAPTETNAFEVDDENNIFSHNARSVQFEAFASDQPLDTSEIESKFSNIITEINNEVDESSHQLTNDNSPWITVDNTSETMQTDGPNKDEPWELEDSTEEKLPPTFTKASQLSAAFNDNEFSTTDKSDLQQNFFSDSFNALTAVENCDNYFTKQKLNGNTEETLGENTHIDINKENLPIETALKGNVSASESSATSDSDVIEVNDITTDFETINDRNTDPMQTSYVNINETDIKVERPSDSVAVAPRMMTIQSESEDLPPPLPPLPPLNDKSSM